MNFGLPSSSLVDLIVLECISRFLLEKTDSNSIESVPSAEAISVFLCFRCSSVANTSLLFNVFFFLGNVSCVYVCVFILLSFSLEGFVFLLLVIMIFLLCFPFSRYFCRLNIFQMDVYIVRRLSICVCVYVCIYDINTVFSFNFFRLFFLLLNVVSDDYCVCACTKVALTKYTYITSLLL